MPTKDRRAAQGQGDVALLHAARIESEGTSAMIVDRTLVEALREHFRAETGQAVSLIETHISWVLLVDRLAYKLKKPVQLSFVDFSTLTARKHYCEEELRLNRRLAPSIYLDVVPVCGTRDSPRLGGRGDAIDFVVRMQRFPESAVLRNLLLEGRLVADQLMRFAHSLASFHGEAQVAPLSSGFGAPGQILRAMNGALGALVDHPHAARVETLRTWAARQGASLRAAWIERQSQGAVREVHGDLHLCNVALIEDALTAFDCIEFDPALRWIDVMSDVAFLTMDLTAHGRPDLAFRFLDVYLQHTGDYAGLPVLRTYEVYRALVRAMVASLRAQAPEAALGAAGPDYLACAEALASQITNPSPRLMITHGLSGSGKSTVAAELLALAGAIRIRSDVERKRLFGFSPVQRSAEHGIDIYTPEATRLTFERLAVYARSALQAGYPVIVDAAFLRRDERRVFRALAVELRVPFSILHCQASEGQLRQRVVTRLEGGTDASEANLAVVDRQLTTYEPLDEEERATALEVVTDQPLDAPSLLARWLALAPRVQGGPGDGRTHIGR